jgi:LysM repeat protein
VLPAAENEAETVRPKFVSTTGDLASTTYHTVEEGDSLWHIAAEHQADVTSIKAANGIEPDEVLRVGQVLRVPSVIDGMEAADQPQKVQRLALSGNVRGSVGGDLSVVFGEELPLAEENTEPNDGLGGPSLAQLEDGTAAQLEPKAQAEVPYELTAAALSNTEAAETRLSSDLAEDASPSLESETTVAALPESMPLSAVKVNPLEELQSAASEDVQTSGGPVAEEVAELDADSVAAVAVAPTATPISAPANSGDGWQNQDIQSAAEAAEELATDKPLAVAALGNRPNETGLELNAPDQAVGTQVYQVKAGDTFWNIASRHGLSPDELIDYNAGQSPESLMVGETIVVPLRQAQTSESTSESTLASATLNQSQQAREAAIRDHVARIREAANREIDQEELKARIIAVRQSLEQADGGIGDTPSLEFHSSQGQSESGTVPQTGVSEVSTPVQSRLGEERRSPVTASDWTVVDAASDSDGTELAALTTPAGSAPGQTEEAVVTPTAVPENLMAVAPMGPEAYRASPQLPIGETVTPGMPILA